MERYLYIAYPFRYARLVSERRAKWLIVITWLYVISVATFGVAFGAKLTDDMPCHYWVFLSPSVFIGACVTQWALPTISIIIIYCRIAFLASKQIRSIERQTSFGSQPAQLSSTLRRQSRITNMMALVLGVYLLTTTPMTMLAVLENLFREQDYYYATHMASLLWWTNAWINPLIYAGRNADFRKAFCLLVGLRHYNSQNSNIISV